MSRLQRAPAPLSVALGLAVLAPASAMAGSTVTFAAGMPTETVFLGRGQYVFDVIGTDGVHEVEDQFEDVYDTCGTTAT